MEPLTAATSAALSEADSITRFIHDFLGDDVTYTITEHELLEVVEDLELVLVELHDLGHLLQLKQQQRGSGSGFEDVLQGSDSAVRSSLTSVLWSSVDVCTQIRTVLRQSHMGELVIDGSGGKRGLPVRVRELKEGLTHTRRTVEVAFGALDDVESSSRLLEEAEHSRKAIPPTHSKLYTSLVRCLDDVERYIEQERVTSYLTEPSPPSTLSLHEMVKSLRDIDTSPDTPATRSQVARPSTLTQQRSAPQSSHLQTIQDEDYYFEKRKVQRQTVHSPVSPRTRKDSLVEHLPPPIYTLFPPAFPPPTKALPPIPPAKSPHRANRLSTASSEPPEIPKKSRARAFSDMTRDSKFSSVSSAATRSSIASQLSSSSYVRGAPQSSSYSCQPQTTSPGPDSGISEDVLDHPRIDIVPIQRFSFSDKDGVDGPVYAIETSPDSTILASRHDKFHIRLSDSSTGESLAILKVQFYVQMQKRSREFFVRSHHVISETLGLIAIATNFGQTIEIWDWAKNKKVQTINDAYRWAAVRDTVFESRCYPLATYSSDDNVIKLYPVSKDHSKTKKRTPRFFDKPRTIELRKAGLPHMPRLPELAYSATAPVLVAAAGPKPPRPGDPPPEHAALLMAWQLEEGVNGDVRHKQKGHAPYKFLHCHELENALPLCLATYGSVALSIWEPAHFRTIGRPGAWQVEPVVVTERLVLVWDFGSADRGYDGNHDKKTTSMYRIPDVLSCVSPDCRFVAYCDSGNRPAQQQSQRLQHQYDAGSSDGALVVLDAMSGRELWRVDGLGGSTGKSEAGGRNSAWSGRSSETKSSSTSASSRANRNALLAAAVGAGSQGAEVLALAGNLDKVTDLAFSGDGSRLFVGYSDGGVGVFEIRETIGMAV